METRDRAKLGRTTYWAYGYRDTDAEVDLVALAEGEYKTLSAAKLAARSWVTNGARQFAIRRGTYESDEINDAEYGTVLDAVWNPTDEWHGFAKGSAVEWEQY